LTGVVLPSAFETAVRAALAGRSWPWLGPRVLIEHADKERAYSLAAAFRRAGYTVAVCAGPAAGDPCPLAGDDGCPLAQVSTVIVSSLGFETREARETLAAQRSLLPETLLIVEADGKAAAAWPELLDGCETVPPGPPEELVERVDALLAH
jgi:hypothetical protein